MREETYTFFFEDQEFKTDDTEPGAAMLAANFHYPLGGGHWKEDGERTYRWVEGNFWD